MADEVTLTIDGQKITVPKDTLVLEAAKMLGIDIPVFCYHHKLEPVGACRQCLVDIEGFRKPQVSCSTKAADGMVVRTNTPEVKEMWKGVLEFLLINHPLDCPVCDRGGECPLQDNTFAYGPTDSRFEHEKRHFAKPVPLSALVLMDRERCILCFRCVRFQREIVDHPQIFVSNRGYRDYIDIFPGKPFESNFSGNTIELCPVGALLSSVFRFRARPWEMTSTESICPDCGVGCNMEIHDRSGRHVARFVARNNDEVNEDWLCDRGRFDSTFINDSERLTKPLVRKNGEFQETTWEEALTTAISLMRKAGARTAGLGSPNRTNEQNYLFQKFIRCVLRTNNIDFTIEPRSADGADALASGLSGGMFNGSIRDIPNSEVILSIGSDISFDLPLIDLWIKKAVWKHGSKLIFAYPLAAELAKYASAFLPYHEGKEAKFAAELSNAVKGLACQPMAGVERESIESASKTLKDAKSISLLVSEPLLRSAERGLDILDSLNWLIDALHGFGANVSAMLLTRDGNSQGAMDVGLLPGYYPGYRKISPDTRAEMEGFWGGELSSERGFSGREIIAKTGSDIFALWIMGLDPVSHLVYDDDARESLGRLDALIVQDYFLTETAKMAHVVLPSSTFAETKGTFTNTERRIQRISPAIRPIGDSLPDTDIILKAAFLTGTSGFDFGRVENIYDEISQIMPGYNGISYDSLGPFGRQWEVR
ncbi:MAG: NADH-quinone oxidoreductase subunit NuoG [Armatimonadota bacterium]